MNENKEKILNLYVSNLESEIKLNKLNIDIEQMEDSIQKLETEINKILEGENLWKN